MTVHRERRGPDGQVLVVTLDRPERRNALDLAELAALREAVTDTDGVRALIVTGAHGHFCSGADLTSLEDASYTEVLQDVLDHLRDAPFPTIAAVEGAALGAGTQLAVACDLRVATDDASFGIPAVKLGVLVTHWTVQRLVSLAGAGPARAMLLTGEVLSGADARSLGLVNRRGALDEALAWADDIVPLAPLTIAGFKVMLDALEPPLGGDERVAAAFALAWGSEDLQEGLTAFRERRRPAFKGT